MLAYLIGSYLRKTSSFRESVSIMSWMGSFLTGVLYRYALRYESRAI